MTYKVAKPLLHPELRESPYIEPLPYIEFDSKEQFEEMSTHSRAYLKLQAKAIFLEDVFLKMSSIIDTARHTLDDHKKKEFDGWCRWADFFEKKGVK